MLIPTPLALDAAETMERVCASHGMTVDHLCDRRARHRLHTACRVEIVYTLIDLGCSHEHIADLLVRNRSTVSVIVSQYADPRTVPA